MNEHAIDRGRARGDAAALARGEHLHDLSVTQPSLEDVYLERTADRAGVA